MANTVNLKDKNKNFIYPTTSWTAIQDKPTNLVTADQLPTLSEWTTAGITFSNGGYPWAGTSTGGSDDHNCAYRITDFGSFKHVELRCIFGATSAFSATTKLINLPSTIAVDWDLNSWVPTSDNNTTVQFSANSISLSPKAGTSTIANYMYSYVFEYYTTA
ncbi:MAG: hypothetical protein ABF575_00215 [Liquorilactobacillus hordei]|uniref:hypothetical protein n=1 Tax=Liquorilactobacillus hordei TaxID=468911 RepID=UPI0039EBB9A0